MKSFGTTFIFAILVAAVGGYSFWEYRKAEKEQEQKSQADKLIAWNKDVVTEILLKRGSELVHFKKQGDGKWQLVAPVTDAADESALGFWLNDILSQDGTLVGSSKEAGADYWKRYGLDSGFRELTLKSQDSDIKLDVSLLSAYDGKFYIRRGDELFIGDVGWAQILEKKLPQLRNKQLFQLAGDVERIEVQRSGYPPLQLELKPVAAAEGKADSPQWVVPGKENIKISPVNVNQFLSDLRELSAADIVADQVDRETLKRFGLDKVATQITLKLKGQDKPYIFTLGQVSEAYDVQARTNQIDAVYRFAKPLTEKVLVSLNRFRDGRLPFAHLTDDVTALKVIAPEKPSVINQGEFVKADSKWKAVGLKEDQEFSENFLINLLNRVKGMEAKVFLPASAAKGMGKTKLEFTKGQQKLTLELGDQFESKDVPKAANPLQYVRVTGLDGGQKKEFQNEVYGVKVADLRDLLEPFPITKKQKAPNPDSKTLDKSKLELPNLGPQNSSQPNPAENQ